MDYKFWLPQSNRYVKVQDMIQKDNPDFEFEEGKTYLVVSEKDCKIHEKDTEPCLQEGIYVGYFYGTPKKFTYTPTNGFFWIVNDNVGGTYVTISEVE